MNNDGVIMNDINFLLGIKEEEIRFDGMNVEFDCSVGSIGDVV